MNKPELKIDWSESALGKPIGRVEVLIYPRNRVTVTVQNNAEAGMTDEKAVFSAFEAIKNVKEGHQ